MPIKLGSHFIQFCSDKYKVAFRNLPGLASALMFDYKKYVIVFVASNIWSRYVADLLRLYGPSDTVFISINTKNILSPWSIYSLLRCTHIVRIGLPPLVPYPKNLVLDMLLSFLGLPILGPKRLYCYWIGSDVLYYARPVGKALAMLRSLFVRHLLHISGSPWLTSELAILGVSSQTIIFPYEIKKISPAWIQSRLQVSWYLPVNNPIGYGQKHLDALADAFPDVLFHVYGCGNYWSIGPVPHNISIYGWIEDSLSLISQCQIHARIIDHDSLGGSVRDALACASHVLYSYSVPFCTLADFGDIGYSIKLLRGYVERHHEGTLVPNYNGQAWVANYLSTDKLTNELATFLLG